MNKNIYTLPRINLNSYQLCDLELIMNGSFYPLDGFMNEKDYLSVINGMRLADGQLFPLPVTLDVNQIDRFKKNSELLLCDEYGKPIAYIKITDIYEPDKLKQAKLVFGTQDIKHPGVNYLLNQSGRYYLSGKVIPINPIDRLDFIEYRQNPKQIKEWFKKNHWKRIIGFQTRNPLHKVHYEMIKTAAKEYKANIFLNPTVGITKEGDIDYITRVRCYIKLHEKYLKKISKLNLLPLAMRMAGPKEALLHALIRKNYGCTHIIIGRDHAGPGKDAQGKPYYQPYDAQNLVAKYAKEIGIEMIPFKEMVYVEEKKKYLPIDKINVKYTIKNISGTKFRQMLMKNKHIPEWFSFPEIVQELKKGVKRELKDGLTIFFTGLPCSGKSTISRLLYFKLLEVQDKKITLLDGDIVRQNLSKGLGFSNKDRVINIQRIGFIASEITKHRGIAICSAIAPHKIARKTNRSLISKYGTYVEVYVSTPLRICRKRDIKGLYRKAELGLIKGFTGVDDPYEIPLNPEITINTVNLNPSQAVDAIIKYLKKNKLIK